jgi:hypothetical protein
VVECARLEIECGSDVTVGSNPTLSVFICIGLIAEPLIHSTRGKLRPKSLSKLGRGILKPTYLWLSFSPFGRIDALSLSKWGWRMRVFSQFMQEF